MVGDHDGAPNWVAREIVYLVIAWLHFGWLGPAAYVKDLVNRIRKPWLSTDR